ncbi:hypothetical protein [Mesorhizobium sp. M4B.F.Ca.ET.214.01.1.1]|uniref:hypothetical protein n=1 Tax=Mesorhizobium sp. M4B.F.Ca.ET.214.01.1.1 TaxID=2563955 RepID=UPI001679969F|nr:hypothetical protein [Mesorhizobium sp. M4B.F.Ca.ET.214.01.1.1]
MKKPKQVTLNGGPPRPRKHVTVKLNETAVERRLRHASEEFRHQRDLDAWKRTK